MGRHGYHPPDDAIKITTYAELDTALSGFVSGIFPLIVILGRPGLAKSQSLKKAMIGSQCHIVKGRISPISFYTSLYHYQDKPIILDDADNLMSQKLCLEYVKALTETDEYKRLSYDTKTSILKIESIPPFFFTTSPVCIVTNAWSENDPVCQAIVSRAEFFHFVPDWGEVYRQAAEWFWDQEIMDYFHERLHLLKTPDCRKFIQAYRRKKADTQNLPWQAVIDGHIDDEAGLILRRILNEDHPTNTKRMEIFISETGHDRATFYRRMADIKASLPAKKVRRLKLKHTEPKKAERPADGRHLFPDDYYSQL